MTKNKLTIHENIDASHEHNIAERNQIQKSAYSVLSFM